MEVIVNTREPLASLLDRHLAASHKPLHRIAKECGFPMPNVLSMIRKGQTKVPLTRIPALARSLDLDERALFEIAVQEYQPDLWSMLDALYGISSPPISSGQQPPVPA